MINKISKWASPFASVQIKEDPIVKRVGYWTSVEIDNIIINHDEPLKPAIFTSLQNNH